MVVISTLLTAILITGCAASDTAIAMDTNTTVQKEESLDTKDTLDNLSIDAVVFVTMDGDTVVSISSGMGAKVE